MIIAMITDNKCQPKRRGKASGGERAAATTAGDEYHQAYIEIERNNFVSVCLIILFHISPSHDFL